jgi:hypothetical protein
MSSVLKKLALRTCRMYQGSYGLLTIIRTLGMLFEACLRIAIHSRLRSPFIPASKRWVTCNMQPCSSSALFQIWLEESPKMMKSNAPHWYSSYQEWSSSASSFVTA